MGLDVDSAENDEVCKLLTEYIRNLRSSLGIEKDIRVEELAEETMNILVANALEDPCMITNPKKLEAEEVKAIYEKILRTNE